jgi:hypothetical protein
MNKIITFDESTKKDIAEILGYKNIDLTNVIGFNKKGLICNILDLIEE